MRRALAVVFVTAVFLSTAAACDSPKGASCKDEGSQMYSSKHGNFVCKKSPFGGLSWQES